MSFDKDYFWEAVSGSHEATAHTAAVVHGKVASATWWPFLSHASSESDFENRLSLVAERIEAAVEPEVYPEVVKSLRDDFRAVYEASRSNANSTSPELAEFNTGLHSRQADLDEEIFDNSTGRWVTASYADTHRDVGPAGRKMRRKDYDDEEIEQAHKDAAREEEDERRSHEKHAATEPNPYVTGERSMCTSCNGWGSYGNTPDVSEKCDDCDGKGFIQHTKKQATNYQPDPNAAWRYHQPYEQIVPGVNNGALQDADGFVTDLAQGEGRSNEVIEQRQLTPGTWTAHDAMPERPMPQGVARGYQPVGSLQVDSDGFYVGSTSAAREDYSGWYRGIWDTGRAHATSGVPPQSSWPRGTAPHDAYLDGYKHGYAGQHRTESSVKHTAPGGGEHAPYRIKEEGGRYYVENDKGERKEEKGYSSRAQAREHQKALYANVPGAAESAEKKHSSLQVDDEGFLVEALVDPAPGTPLKVNPYYFQDGSEVGGNDGFPVDPGPEPLESRSDTYGDVAPASSAGSTQGTSDGKGYSRSHPGESPNFNQTAGRHSSPDGVVGLEHNDYPSQGEVYDVLRANRLAPTSMIDQDHGTAHGLLGLPPAKRHNAEYMRAYERGTNAHRTAGWHDTRPDYRVDGGNGGYRDRPDPSEYADLDPSHPDYSPPRQLAGKELEDFNKRWGFEASTDGKIVDHCPGCKQPRRAHSTPHGDEIRHLHNDHVRCFGKNANAAGSAVGNDRTTEDDDEDMDDELSSTASSLPQFFDPTLSSGNVHTADYLGRPDANNPTGRGADEYRAERWNAYQNTRPMQQSTDRNINTPVLPQEHIRTPNVNTPTPGLKDGLQVTRDEDREDDDDED